jgi:hypothetical protein
MSKYLPEKGPERKTTMMNKERTSVGLSFSPVDNRDIFFISGDFKKMASLPIMVTDFYPLVAYLKKMSTKKRNFVIATDYWL